MQAALAATPIAAMMALIVGLRWSAAAAGAVSAALAAVIGVAAFGFGEGQPAQVLVGSVAEAGFSAGTILWILFAALAIHEFQTRSGGVERFARWLETLGSERRIAVMMVAWFFALFLEGAAGFGTPVALAAPLLTGLGVPPVHALTAVLVGHAAGVSFGAVGTPIVPLALGTGIPPATLAVGIAGVHAALGWALAVATLRCACNNGGGTSTAFVAAGLFLLPYLLIAWAVGPELPTLGGAAAGAAGFLVILRLRRSAEATPASAGIGSAAAPYLAIVLLVLATRLIDPVRETLQGLALSWSLEGGFAGSVAPLYHPGTLLLIGLAAVAIPRAAHRPFLLPALKSAAKRLPPVAVALFSALLLARLMLHAGMVDALARSAAAATGRYWPLAAPGLGALGSFITGSGTTSNILFADLQQVAALRSATSPVLAAVGQGVGAGIGNIIAPHNIVAGAATVGLIGAEAAVLRKTFPICLAYAAAAGLLLLGVGSLGLVAT